MCLQAIDVDLDTKVVYWTDSSTKTISRALLPDDHTQMGYPQDLGIEGIATPNGIAFDWVAK